MNIGGLGANAALLAAVLDLKEVQSVVRAMRAVDRGANNNPVLSLTPQPRPVIHPQPRYEPRPVIHPTPRYLPRPVIHPQPRIDQQAPACDCQASASTVIVEKPPVEMPIEPPWKTLPWKMPVQPAPKVKVIQYHPDMVRRGMLLDYFV